MTPRTSINDLENDVITEGNFSGPFDDISINQFIPALANNKKLEKLDLSMCLLEDKGLALIAEALIKRNLCLKLLNIDFNDLTANSLNSILSLIEKGIVKILYMRNHPLIEDSACMEAILAAAKKYSVEVSTDNPLKRQGVTRMMLIQKQKVDVNSKGNDSEHKEQYSPK